MKTIVPTCFASFSKTTCWLGLAAFAGLVNAPVASAQAQAAAPKTTVVQRHGQLRVQGNRIVDAHGKPVVLRGMSLFWSQWIGKFYQPETVKWLRDDWNCTVIRAALAVDPDGYLQNPQQEKQKIFTVVDAAIAQGIYVIIDWHDHEANKHLKESQAFFAEISAKYKDSPNVIYELWNEPLNDASWSQTIKPYHEAVIATIRKNDPDNIIVCGTRSWSQRVDEAAQDPIKAPNIAYTLHFYAASHKQWLRDAATKAMNGGIALMATEWGTSEASGNGTLDADETRVWWKFLDDNGISWCNWSVADAPETSAALKPGAADKGGWPDDVISPSGLMVRAELRAKNNAPTTP